MDTDEIRTKRPDMTVAGEGQKAELSAASGDAQKEKPRTIVAGRYEIIERLAAGRTGAVWKAKDKKSNEFVVVREFSRMDTKNLLLADRFNKGLGRLSTLSHPNIIEPCDSGVTDDNVPYVVTPFLDEPTLKQMLSLDKVLTESKAVEIFVPIAEAIAHAHIIGVEHGNLSLGNVFVHEDAKGTPGVTLTDFGIETLFQSSMFDPQDDVFAFGTLMYECLNGALPQTSEDSLTLEAPFHNAISPELKSIILNCLSLNRKDRYASGSEVLDNLIAMRCQRLPMPPKERPGQKFLTPKFLIPLVACVVVATAAICALVTMQPKPSISNGTPTTPAQTPSVTNIRHAVSNQKNPVARLRRTAPGPSEQLPSQGSEPAPLESLQQPIPLESAVNSTVPSLTKEKVEKTAAMGAVGGLAVYDSLAPGQRQQVKDAAVSGLSKGLKNWQSLNDDQKASVKRSAAGAVGKAIKLWKQLPAR
jgi:serine/threonine protein kinase